jgi:hypothetical protein
MQPVQNFFLRFYFHVLSKLLAEPRCFFSELPVDVGFIKPLGFLIVSSIFFTGASLISSMPSNPFYLGGIYFINAVGMALIASGLGYMVMVMILGRLVTFKRLFSIYALSSGITLLAAWIPFFIWLTEPWKWWLIGTGMVKACGLRGWQAILIIVLSAGIIILLFWTALPMVAPPNGSVAVR